METLFQKFEEIVSNRNHNITQENANVDGFSPMGMMSLFAASSAKEYAISQLLTEEAKEAYEEGYIHIHDLDFYTSGTTTCCQIPLGKLLKDGFDTGHGTMREPKSISSALALTSIILQANQNMQHGGQSIPCLDYDLAPYIQFTFQKKKQLVERLSPTLGLELITEEAWHLTEQEVYQACEAFVHNCNSMHSRGGGQTPFVSVNLGTDTSKEGRMLSRNLLLAVRSGLGKGETPIFPIVVFKVKSGVNFHEKDANYDLYRLSLETTSRRLFPNYVFLDAPFNLQYYDGSPDSEVATMGCRTRVIGNIHGKETPVGRGNLSFTTINLPMLALESTTVQQFFDKLDHYMELSIRQLIERYHYQGSKYPYQYKFLYHQGVWWNGEQLAHDTNVAEIIKQGTLSVGFIGLAEALVQLVGAHHGENEEAQALGLRIVNYMRQRMDQAILDYQLNFSLLATPAESLAGRALRVTRKKHGLIAGITDREYFTNSFHIPVYYPIRALNKIKLEAPYHELTNAGHITYVEVDGDASRNIDALDALVRAMHQYGIGYGSINHPVDRCLPCGYKGIINDKCPICDNEDERQIERIRRITGYLVGSLNRWNEGKRSEERDRVKHQLQH